MRKMELPCPIYLKSKIDFQCIKVGEYTNTSSVSRNERNIYLIDSKSGYNDNYSSYPVIHDSKYIHIYDITDSICGRS